MPDDTVPNCQAFPVTPWSLIGRAVDGKDQRSSLEELLKRYLPALRAHLVYSKRMPTDRADDLLQSFITDKIVERGIVASAQQSKGKFRTFLLTALTRYHVSEIRKSRAQKRGPESGDVNALDDAHEPADETTASNAFEIEWARQVVAEATRRTEEECKTSGHANVWQLLKARVLDPALEGIEPLEYKRLVEKFDLKSPMQVSNLLVTGRRMYARNLNAVIAEYASSEDEVAEEMRDLRSILGKAIL